MKVRMRLLAEGVWFSGEPVEVKDAAEFESLVDQLRNASDKLSNFSGKLEGGGFIVLGPEAIKKAVMVIEPVQEKKEEQQ